MTQFVGVRNMVRWIQRDGVEAIIREMMGELDRDFGRWQSFEKIPRLASHSPIGVIELMPTSDGEQYSFKYVNGHPSNPARGFQTVTAFGALADVNNGYPVFVAEMTLLTALRTAAISALVAKYLGRPDSRSMAMIGSGSQAEFQALGMRAALGIENLTIYDVDPNAMEKFRRNMEPLGFTITICGSADEAILGADVVTTCTADKQLATVLQDHQVAPGVHINAIGGDCPGKTELDSAILDRASVFVEFEEQTRIEGEIQQVAADFPVTEFWEVVAGKHPGRTSPDEITVFDSVGFAISDFAALKVCRRMTDDSDLQDAIDLIANPDDPKDLFAMTLVSSPV